MGLGRLSRSWKKGGLGVVVCGGVMPGQVAHRVCSLHFLILLLRVICGGHCRRLPVLEERRRFTWCTGAADEAGDDFSVAASCFGRAVKSRGCSVQGGGLAFL